jgi:hypothetical protein
MRRSSWRARCLELLTRCYLAAGRRAEAARSVEAARACADAVQLPLAAAMASLAEAALDIDGGLPASAATRAIDAATMLEEVDAAFDAAGARLLAGRALAQAGEQDAAAAELERARAASTPSGRCATAPWRRAGRRADVSRVRDGYILGPAGAFGHARPT